MEPGEPGDEPGSPRAVVTGSTAGIGLAIAMAFAAEGASVVVNGRTQARVTAAIERIRQTVRGARVQGVAADLGTATGVETFVGEVPEAEVLLVNDLGIFEAKPFGEIPDADWVRFFEVNVLSDVRRRAPLLRPEVVRDHPRERHVALRENEKCLG